jgi:hypothetical protein
MEAEEVAKIICNFFHFVGNIGIEPMTFYCQRKNGFISG